MYSFLPTEEQQMLIDAVRRFAEGDVRPVARDMEEAAEMSADLVEKGWELGVLQASIPEEYGGFGDYSAVTGVLAAEELGWGDLATALAVMAPNLFVLPIYLGGTEEQKARFIPEVIEAEWRPFTGALLEYRMNFNPFELQTTAVKEGDAYVLNGEKAFVPYGKDAESMVVYANLDGQTQAFIVPGDAEGLQVGDEREKLMGINALPMYRVKLENVRVPLENRIGGEDGFDFKTVLAHSYVALAALAVGVARASLEYSTEYAKQREAFGVKIGQKQAIAFMLAEMATEVEASRLLTWEAAWMLDTGKEDAFKQAYLAYTGAMDMVMMVTDRGVQILGGYGYIREYPVEMWMRNGRGFATFSGMALV